MNKKTYDKLEKAWKDFFTKEEEYYRLREALIRAGGDEREISDLEKKYGHSGFDAAQWGPWTEISDPSDLKDLGFILPGRGIPFLRQTNTDLEIPEYFGKWAIDEVSPEECSGEVIGYGYDVGDDYLVIKTKDGGKRFIMVNSHYTIVENEEEFEAWKNRVLIRKNSGNR